MKILGPALVDAYKTETEAAIYPRVILDKTVIDKMKETYSFNRLDSYRAVRFDGTIDSYLIMDSDDKLYIDYFARAGYYFEEEKLVSYYSTLRKQIINGLKYKSPRIKAKYSWMKNKFNNVPKALEQIDVKEELFYKRPDILKIKEQFKEI
ncbi:hypothetical protein PKOR_13495 [Pontibacter korlensis]|uniref:Uncharacterized protein n=1 Tax=Pontibacter korlensis TaxID=400092 RepID=A0A0E3ZH77_9BACT|nr:hypothetical protein [Pontibacter korlensis]AKD03930.1 hypothetical protein PKOR_13495 [Pontibacter korlensis]